MKIAVLTDTHHGFKNASPLFHNYFKKFYDDVFFPELKRRGIKTIIHLGDFFDARKHLNVQMLHATRKDIIEPLSHYDVHLLIGNHDCYYRENNAVNSPKEILQHYSNIRIYEEIEEVVIGGRRILFVPWLNETNMGPGLERIAKSKSTVLMGHLELAGVRMDRSQISQHGLEKGLFGKFKKVFSGHFHTQSIEGNLHYLGSSYEMTFIDAGDDKGFHIFDTETLETEFIPNPYRMFNFFRYDDRDETQHGAMLTADYSEFSKTFVRVNVLHKTNPHVFDQVINRIQKVNPADLDIRETYSLNVAEEADEQFEVNPETGDVVITDTLTILDTYVDSIGMQIDKSKLKLVLRDLHRVAVSAGAKE